MWTVKVVTSSMIHDEARQFFNNRVLSLDT
jgi:hypothetical protein